MSVTGSLADFHQKAYFQRMMKTAETVKITDTRAVEAVRELLGSVSGVQIESVERGRRIAHGSPADGLVHFACRRAVHTLVVGMLPSGAPRFVRSGVHQIEGHASRLRRTCGAEADRHFVPMLVSPYLSPAARAICEEHDVAYLDLVGNARLALDAVHIERAVSEKPVSETRSLRSIFAPQAAAILRALLREPDRAWRVADLASQARASYGHVSNVRKALLEREWAEVGKDGMVLVQPGALMRTWRESYRRPDGQKVIGYTLFHGRELYARLRGTLNPHPERPRAIWAWHSAADWFAPYVRDATHVFYADERGAEALKQALDLIPGAKGANVVVVVPKDVSLFHDASQPQPNVFCTSPIATYLDLWAGNDREQEGAEHLASRFFQWHLPEEVESWDPQGGG